MKTGMHPRSRSRVARRRGFAMLEALVGGLIFSIGVLGLISLQARMTQTQTVSQFRGDATYLSDELFGLLWSDRANLASYATAGCPGYPRCADWSAKVGRSLPGGTPAVTVNAATGLVNVSITWTTRSGNQSYATSTSVTP